MPGTYSEVVEWRSAELVAPRDTDHMQDAGWASRAGVDARLSCATEAQY
jgi:hypothetical protein